MRLLRANKGFTLIELIIVGAILVFVISIAGIILVSGINFFRDGTERVKDQTSIRNILVEISQQLHSVDIDDDILLVMSSTSINIAGTTYLFDVSAKTITRSDGVNPAVVIANDIESFDVSRVDNTVTITIETQWNDSAISTKVTLRSIPTPTPLSTYLP